MWRSKHLTLFPVVPNACAIFVRRLKIKQNILIHSSVWVRFLSLSWCPSVNAL